MVDKKRLRKLLELTEKEISDKQLDQVRGSFYSLGYLLLEWCERKKKEWELDENDNKSSQKGGEIPKNGT